MTNKKRIKITQTAFLTQLYKSDPLIANQDAYEMLKRKFPKTKTTQRTLTSSWKFLLRRRGIRIPYQRQKKKGNKK